MRFLRLSPFKIGVLLTMGIMALFMSDQINEETTLTRILRLIENKAYDYRFVIRGRQQPPGDDVLIVTIDEKSIEELGQWPWPREQIAKVYDILRADGAAVIANDVVFDKPDRNDGHVERLAELASKYRSLGLQDPSVLPKDFDDGFSDILAQLSSDESAELRRRIASLRSNIRESSSDYAKLNADFYQRLSAASVGGNDKAFARAIKEFPGAVLGYFFFEDAREMEGLAKEEYIKGFDLINESKIIPRIVQTENAEDQSLGVIKEGLGVVVDVPVLSQAANYHGYFNAEQDIDGVIRRSRLVTRRGEELYPSLALEAFLAFMRQIDPEAQIGVTYDSGIGISELAVGGLPVPVDERGRLLIKYYGPQKQFLHYSFTDVFNRRFPKGTFQNKVIFFGATSIGVYDLRTTPFEKAYPGVETHATVAQNLISRDFMRAPNNEIVGMEFLGIALLGLVIAFLASRVRALLGAAMSAAVALGIVVGNYTLFESGYWINILYPILTVGLVYGGIVIFRYATEEKEKKQIKEAFGLYLHPAMVEQLADRPDSLKLGGEKRNITAFFSDIQGFSTFSEGMEPENLVNFLNEYLTAMTDILQGYDATVDKYIGDAIVAFFGAPLPFKDHAAKACHATLDMQRTLDGLRHGWKEKGLPLVFQRIGMNTGDVVVGNMGSKKRFNYTMMGDTVNLAARLESGAKQYGVYQMIGENTEKAARDQIESRWLDYLVVKGKSVPVNIYELVAKKGELAKDQMWQDVLGLWKDGVAAYRARNFMGALAKFEEIHNNVRPSDGPSKVYIERCQAFIANPPPEDWDGVWIATSK